VNKVTRLTTREQRLENAADWIARFDRGLRDGEQQALEAWLDEDAGNRESLLLMLETWDKSDSLGRLAELFPEPVQRRRRLGGLAWSGAIATALVAAVVAVFVLLPDPAGTPEPIVAEQRDSQIFETLVGARKTFELADGSIVHLNTNSLIDVHFSPGERRLELQRGEATFTVAHDASRPFRVVVGQTVFEAVGTEFNLQITNDRNIELVVTDGKVRVAASLPGQGDGELGTIDVPLLETPVLVAAGQEFMVGGESSEAMVIDRADIEVRLSWRKDNLVFRGETLGQVLDEIGRYTTVEFVLLDDELREESVGGMFKVGDIQGTLQSLEQYLGVSYQMVDGNTVLLSKR